MNASEFGPVLPWWRVPMVWLTISGPAVVVIAGFITLALAIHGRDLEVPHSSGQHHVSTRQH
jgi:hypothetical protein